MIRFIHTADIHFGVENYGRIDPETGIHTRLLDFYTAFNACIDHAIQHNVDFFIFSGDAYKTAHPSQTQQKLLFKSFMRLYAAHIPVVIIVGNHDHPLSFGKAHALNLFGELPIDGFHVVSQPTTINLTTKNGPVQIVGIPWPTRNTLALSERSEHKSAAQLTEHISRAVAHIISQKAQELDPTIPAVLGGHLTVSSGIFSGSEKRAIYGTDPILQPSQLAIKPFDYVALGHLHRFQDLNPNGHPPVVYAGSIERVDFGERKEKKGFCDVTIHHKEKTTYTFIETPQRPFVQIEVQLSSTQEQTEELIKAIKKHTIKDAVIKIIYHVPAGSRDMVNSKVIQEACTDAWYIVGIIPVIPAQTRSRRVGALKVDMKLSDLLSTYFDTKPHLQDKKNNLIEKTLQIAQEIMHENEQE